MSNNDEMVKLAEVLLDNYMKATDTYADMLNRQLKLCQERRYQLLENKPLFLSGKAKKLFEKELKEVEKEILDIYKKASDEVKSLSELKEKMGS